MIRKQVNSITITDNDFKTIYSIFMENAKTRDEFFSNPELLLKNRGIFVDPEVIEIIKRVSIFNIDGERMSFNEKLVLCSSSGY